MPSFVARIDADTVDLYSPQGFTRAGVQAEIDEVDQTVALASADRAALLVQLEKAGALRNGVTPAGFLQSQQARKAELEVILAWFDAPAARLNFTAVTGAP